MKKVQGQLQSIAKSLSALSKQVDGISKQLGKSQPAKKAAPKKNAPKATAAKKTAEKKAVKQKAAPEKKQSVLDTVLGVIKRSRKGATITALKEKTDLDSRQLSNALYKLAKRGVIASQSRGVYVKQ